MKWKEREGKRVKTSQVHPFHGILFVSLIIRHNKRKETKDRRVKDPIRLLIPARIISLYKCWNYTQIYRFMIFIWSLIIQKKESLKDEHMRPCLGIMSLFLL